MLNIQSLCFDCGLLEIYFEGFLLFSPFRDLAGNAVWKNILVDISAAVVEISMSVVLGCCLKRVG